MRAQPSLGCPVWGWSEPIPSVSLDRDTAVGGSESKQGTGFCNSINSLTVKKSHLTPTERFTHCSWKSSGLHAPLQEHTVPRIHQCKWCESAPIGLLLSLSRSQLPAGAQSHLCSACRASPLSPPHILLCLSDTVLEHSFPSLPTKGFLCSSAPLGQALSRWMFRRSTPHTRLHPLLMLCLLYKAA